MDVVDAQIHVWDDDTSERPWDPHWGRALGWMLDHGQAMTIDRAVAAMDAVGVTGAIVVSFPLYPDVEYAVEASTRHPDRFRTVTHVDLDHPHPEEEVERLSQRPEVVAVRFAFAVAEDGYARLARGEFAPAFSGAERCGVPVMLAVSGNVGAAEIAARSHPNVQLIVDHLGLAQPHGGDSLSPEPFARLGELLALAAYPNVAVKFSGMPTLSAAPYPYTDLWPHLHAVIDAFGLERSLWGSDFSRTRPVHTYAEALNFLEYTDELSRDEKALLLGTTARRLLQWPATSA